MTALAATSCRVHEICFLIIQRNGLKLFVDEILRLPPREVSLRKVRRAAKKEGENSGEVLVRPKELRTVRAQGRSTLR